MNHGGLGVSRKKNTGAVPVWQGQVKDIQLVQGGFTLDQTGYSRGDVIPAGSPVVFVESTRQATIMRTGIAQATAASNATEYRVKKGSTLKVGDNLASGAVGGKAYPITAIDTTTSADYDALTVGTTIGAVTAGDTLYASTATGATASALPAINGRLYSETEVDTDFKVTIGVVIRGTVYARRVPNSAAIEAALKTNGAYIIHSQSF